MLLSSPADPDTNLPRRAGRRDACPLEMSAAGHIFSCRMRIDLMDMPWIK